MNKLEEMRKSKDWTRRKLSSLSGISEQTIYKLEKTDYKAKPIIIMKLAKALDAKFDDFKDMIKGMENLLF